MLSPAPSNTMNQDGLHIFFKMAVTPPISLFARLLLAKDPYGPFAFDVLQIARLGRAHIGEDTITQVFSNLANPELLKGKVETRLEKIASDLGEQLAPMHYLSMWLGQARLSTLPHGHYMRSNTSGGPPPVLEAENGLPSKAIPNTEYSMYACATRLARLMDSPPEVQASWLTEDAIDDLASLTLQLRFRDVVADSDYSGDVDVAPGQSRELHPILTRLSRILCLIVTLRDGIQLAPLRELARLFTSPPMQPVLEYVQPGFREQTLQYCSQLLAIPVHPWVAQVERLALPTKRQTPWGMNASQGLVGGLGPSDTTGTGWPPKLTDFSGAWKQLLATSRTPLGGTPTTLRDPSETRVLKELVTVKHGLFSRFSHVARAVLLRRSLLPQAQLDKSATLLRYTQPTTPPQIHLHGDTWTHLVRSGDSASGAVADWTALLLQPNMAYSTPGELSLAFGDVDALFYNARIWQTGENGTTNRRGKSDLRRGAQPPLFVTPAVPAYTEGYGLQLTPPEAIRMYVPTEYFGDKDALIIPYTAEAVAKVLGYSSVDEMTARSSVLAERLRHILEFNSQVKGGTWEKPAMNAGVGQLFISSRTRQPWRRRVDVGPSLVTEQIGIDERATPQKMANIEAVIIRTEDIPTLNADMLQVADGLADKVLAEIGAPMGGG